MSDPALRKTSIALALLGVAIAGYLTWVHYAGLSPVCVGGSHGCETVQSSDYAELAGVPVALLGLVGYLAILATTFLEGYTWRAVGAVLGLAGTAFSLYLTYLELFQIHAICQWCVGSAIVMTILTVVLAGRAVKSA
ncbi:MAG: hypothetical protein QOG62_1000 [Thermoleophilaceae bacterium]|jgi:uncharacterized membrane protein|nr:hypothetical protein [Thermoleophilaceae bacterium]